MNGQGDAVSGCGPAGAFAANAADEGADPAAVAVARAARRRKHRVHPGVAPLVIDDRAEVRTVDDTCTTGGPATWVRPEGRTDRSGIAPPATSACKTAQPAIPFS